MGATKTVVIQQLCEKRFVGENEGGQKVIVDGASPPVGLRPMELLLAALGGCTAYDVVDIMKKKRTPLTRYRVEVSGQRAQKHPRRYTHIHVVHVGAGPGVTEKQFAHAVRLSHEKFCSASANLNAEITWEVRLEEVPDEEA